MRDGYRYMIHSYLISLVHRHCIYIYIAYIILDIVAFSSVWKYCEIGRIPKNIARVISEKIKHSYGLFRRYRMKYQKHSCLSIDATYSSRRVNHIGSINHWLKGISREIASRLKKPYWSTIRRDAYRWTLPARCLAEGLFWPINKPTPKYTVHRETRHRRVDTNLEFPRAFLYFRESHELSR